MTKKEQKGAFAGAEWIESNMKYWKKTKAMEMSALGCRVADLLGELFCGIYHLDDKQLAKVEWNNNHHIVLILGWNSLATFDSNTLTRLVFLAHHLCLRVDIRAKSLNYLELMFHPRVRGTGGYSHMHPTLDEAVAGFKKRVSLPEYMEMENG